MNIVTFITVKIKKNGKGMVWCGGAGDSLSDVSQWTDSWLNPGVSQNFPAFLDSNDIF